MRLTLKLLAAFLLSLSAPAHAVQGLPLPGGALPLTACEIHYEASVAGPASAAYPAASCGAVLFDEGSLSGSAPALTHFVLTAGHCGEQAVRAQLRQNFAAYLRAGARLRQANDLHALFSSLPDFESLALRAYAVCPRVTGAEPLAIVSQVTHPEFRRRSDDPEENAPTDLTLMRLAAPIAVAPARLILPPRDPGAALPAACLIAGPGLNNEKKKGKLAYAQIDLPFIYEPEHGVFTAKHYLARTEARLNAGVGDSGGPILCPDADGKFENLYGIFVAAASGDEEQPVPDDTFSRLRASVFGAPTADVRIFRAVALGDQLKFLREAIARLR